jgi:hypothetical protein
VFPNPTNDLLTIHITKQVNDGLILIEDINGKVIRRLHGIIEGNNSIDLTDTMNGIYILRLMVDSGEYITRIVKN